jgi:hypothetical protein
MMGELAKQDYFTELDRRDQEQIIMEATGEASKELFYDVNGKKGLSYEGVNTVTFFMGDIETETWYQREKVELNGQVFWSTTVRAVNKTFNLAALGTAEVPEMMDVYDIDPKTKKRIQNEDGSFKMHKEFDRFVLRKSMSMAQRNAKRAVMPTPMLQKFLEYFVRRAGGDTKAEIPYNPRRIPSDYKVLPDQTGGEDRKEKTPPPAKKTPESKPTLSKKPLTKEIIEYNLKALDPNYLEVLEVIEYETEFMIAAKLGIDLPDNEQYKIDSTLQPMGAIWTNNRYWRIPRVAAK